MTLQSPRIYIYKITFEEVLYYYYGAHKEKVFDEEYWGTPVANKWCWKLYNPKKQILQLFDYSGEGWLEALEVEKRLIKTFYKTDKWCLNENCGGILLLKQCSEAGKIGGKVTQERGIGLFSLTREERIELGKRTYWEGKGLGILTPEQRIENAKKYSILAGSVSGKNHKKNKTGIFSIEPEQHSQNSKKGGTKTKELGVGIFAIPPEKVQERNKKNALQRWECLETGFVTNAGNLTKYQRARGIDTSKRQRIS